MNIEKAQTDASLALSCQLVEFYRRAHGWRAHAHNVLTFDLRFVLETQQSRCTIN